MLRTVCGTKLCWTGTSSAAAYGLRREEDVCIRCYYAATGLCGFQLIVQTPFEQVAVGFSVDSER